MLGALVRYWYLVLIALFFGALATIAALNSGPAVQTIANGIESHQAQSAAVMLEDARFHPIVTDLTGVAVGEPSNLPGWQKTYGLVTIYFVCKPNVDPSQNRTWFGWQMGDKGNAASWRNPRCLTTIPEEGLQTVIRMLKKVADLPAEVGKALDEVAAAITASPK